MAPKSYDSHVHSKSARCFIDLTVATVFDDSDNNSIINIDHSYTRDELIGSSGVIHELDSFDHLIIPYQNSLLTIHQEQDRIYPEINSLDPNIASAVFVQQQSNLHLYLMDSMDYFGEMAEIDDFNEENKYFMILISDFFQNSQRNRELLREIIELAGCSGDFCYDENAQTCDEYGQPELIGCDPFLCTSRQIFDLCFHCDKTLEVEGGHLSLNEFLKCISLETLSEVKNEDFRLSFIFFPQESEDPRPIMTSFMKIEDLSLSANFTLTFDQNLLILPRRYCVFCILGEVARDGNVKELILHQGPLVANKSPLIKFL